MEVLLLSNSNKLFDYARRLTGEHNAAWDLFQDSCARILTHNGQYIEQGKFLSWAMTVMKHIFLNHEKSTHRRVVRFIDGYSQPAESKFSTVVADTGADSYYITNEMLDIIDHLPAHQSRAFRLFIDGHSYADIAAKMQVSTDCVRNYIHSARVTLRKMVGCGE